MADHNAEVVCPNCGKYHERPQSGPSQRTPTGLESLNLMVALKYCPNGECVAFQCEVETSIGRCRLCGWEMQLVEKHSDSVRETSTRLHQWHCGPGLLWWACRDSRPAYAGTLRESRIQ